MGLRLGYLCMQSEFSVQPLRALLRAGHDVRFVLRPLPRAYRRDSVLLRPEDVHGALRLDARREPFHLAGEADIPRWLVGDASSAPVRAFIEDAQVDALVICFFNQLLSAELLAALPLGAINAHPSLLPAYRGPAPLFWTFKEGREETGVTVHKVAPGEDDGDVISQRAIPLPFGTRGEDLVPALASAAADGVLAAIDALAEGRLQATPQDTSLATRAPRPDESALEVLPSLGARRVFSWVRGVGRWNRLHFDASGVRLRVVDALGPSAALEVPGDYALVDDRLTLRCDDGFVTLQVAEDLAAKAA